MYAPKTFDGRPMLDTRAPMHHLLDIVTREREVVSSNAKVLYNLCRCRTPAERRIPT